MRENQSLLLKFMKYRCNDCVNTVNHVSQKKRVILPPPQYESHYLYLCARSAVDTRFGFFCSHNYTLFAVLHRMRLYPPSLPVL